MNNEMNGFNPNPMDPMNNGMPNNNPNPVNPMMNNDMNNMGPNPMDTMAPPMDNGMMPNTMNNMAPPMDNGMMPNGMNNMAPPMNNGMMPNPTGIQPNGMNPNMMGNNLKPGKKFNPIFVVIPVIIAIAIVAFLLIGGKNSYKDPIELYCEGMNTLDLSILEKAVPKEYMEDMDAEDKEDFKELQTEMKKMGYKLTCEIPDTYKELTESELKELNDDFHDDYDTTREITEAYKVEITRTVEYNFDGEKYDDDEEAVIIVGKIDGTWYYIDEE